MDVVAGSNEVPNITGLNYIPIITRVSVDYGGVAVYGMLYSKKWIVISKVSQNVTVRFLKYPEN